MRTLHANLNYRRHNPEEGLCSRYEVILGRKHFNMEGNLEPRGAGVGELQNRTVRRLFIGFSVPAQLAPRQQITRLPPPEGTSLDLATESVHIRERPVCEWLISLMQKMRNGKGIACHPFEFVGVPLPILHFQTDAGVEKNPGLSIFFNQTCRLLHAPLKTALLSGWFALFSHASMRAFAACLENISSRPTWKGRNPSSTNGSPRHALEPPAATASAGS